LVKPKATSFWPWDNTYQAKGSFSIVSGTFLLIKVSSWLEGLSIPRKYR
jgi:hypothetical protein